jgi:hypothetical protein
MALDVFWEHFPHFLFTFERNLIFTTSKLPRYQNSKALLRINTPVSYQGLSSKTPDRCPKPKERELVRFTLSPQTLSLIYDLSMTAREEVRLRVRRSNFSPSHSTAPVPVEDLCMLFPESIRFRDKLLGSKMSPCESHEIFIWISHHKVEIKMIV